MDNKKIGSFICELRKEQGMNQKELADKIGVTDKAVSKWETGRGAPDISILTSLATVLNVTVSEILNGERSSSNSVIVDDAEVIKKYKKKRILRILLELAITFLFILFIYGYAMLFVSQYLDIISLNLYIKEIQYYYICFVIFMFFFLMWLVLFIITAIAKKRAIVFKTVLFCFLVIMSVIGPLGLGAMHTQRHEEIIESPVNYISYIDYNELFDETNKDIHTRITIKDTNDRITENYSAYIANEEKQFDFVSTECISSADNKIVKDKYNFDYLRNKESDELIEIDDDLCSKLGISEGYYTLNNYLMCDIKIFILKNNSYYIIEITNKDKIDNDIIKAINNL